MKKQKLLVSFSAGETSAYMAHWIKQNHSDKFEIVNVFANTGEECEETLIFADKCDKYFGLNLVWVEPKIIHEKNKGTVHRVVDFKSAERTGVNGNFEDYIIKYGIPNVQNQTCTREMKERPIRSYLKSIGWSNNDYYTAIGIRSDEIDRISKHRIQNRIIYPFIEMIQVTKPMVNMFFSKMPFRLNIKGYEGNCKWCYKKSLRKLATISIENEDWFEFPLKMTEKYGSHVIEGRKHNNNIIVPINFFRENKNVEDVKNIALLDSFKKAKDDKMYFEYQNKLDLEVECIGSCEPFQ